MGRHTSIAHVPGSVTASMQPIFEAAIEVLEEIDNDRFSDLAFLEGQACIGGCVNGAGSLTHSAKNQQLVEKHGKEAERKTIQDSISHPDASFKH